MVSSGGRTRKERHGLLLEKDPELERLADEVDVDMGDLQSPLRYGLDQTFRLQPRNCFPDRAQWQTRQFHEAALRNELPRANVAREKVMRKAFIRPFPQCLFAGIVHAQPFKVCSGGLFAKQRVECAFDLSPALR